jgi:CheY-like chemotaxis protein
MAPAAAPGLSGYFSWTVIGFLTTSLVIILLALAVKTDSARWEWAGKLLAVSLGLVVSQMLQEAASAGKPYGLALLDFQMPEMDGLELARAIKSDPRILATRLVLLTSHGELLSACELEEFGIDSCVIKPARQERLFDCITEAVCRMPVQSGPPEAPVLPLGMSSGHQGKKILLADELKAALESLAQENHGLPEAVASK